MLSCGNRDYEKVAIAEAIRYFLGGQYKNLRQLAEENYRTNTKLAEKYSSLDDFVSNLQLPDKLSCSQITCDWNRKKSMKCTGLLELCWLRAQLTKYWSYAHR